MLERHYSVAPRGMATSFTESEIPPASYCLKFRNRFLNSVGGAEKRRGLAQLGSDIPGTPSITSLHELVKKDKTVVTLAAGGGHIFSYDTATSAWSTAYSGVPLARLDSVQMNEKLIFTNGTSRPFWTDNATTFQELQPIIIRGTKTGAGGAGGLKDSNVGDGWIDSTQVAVNDIVYNETRGGYGVVTEVTASGVNHTIITSAGTGLGQVAGSARSGDRYRLLDLVELNIIPTEGLDDNIATTETGTNATTIKVSGVAFANTDIRVGDFVRNTTRGAIAMVSAISASALTVTSIASQTGGDSLIFLKSAVPIADKAHVHYGRLYMIDNRDPKTLVVSGPNDPEDFSTDAGLIDSSIFRSGALQPTGDHIVDMSSFQQYFVLGGKRNVYFFTGRNPITDVSASPANFESTSVDFIPIALFPQGVVGPRNLISIGNDVAFTTLDGLQAAAFGGDTSTLGRANISEQVKTRVRSNIESAGTDNIELIHYEKRSWLLLKIGTEIWVYNYIDQLGEPARVIGNLPDQNRAAWHVFDGKMARQNAYLVRQDQSMICGGAGGKVYTFDVAEVYDDDGEVYATEYQSAWLGLDETRSRPLGSTRIKDLKYYRPTLAAGQAIEYSVTIEAPFNQGSLEKITVAASGGATPIGLATIGGAVIGASPIAYDKYPLRARGERMKLTVTTNDNKGPDVMGEFTMYHNIFGVR